MSPSPTRITTAEELDALPPGTVIRDDEGTGYAVNSSAGTWGAAGTGGLWDSSTILLVMHAPFTVLHDPAAPPVSDTAAATIAEVLGRHALAPVVSPPIAYWSCACDSMLDFGLIDNGHDLRHLDLHRAHQGDVIAAALGLPVTSEVEG